MIVLCGLDGGGTKTLCALADGSGRVLALHASGPSNFLTVGRTEATEALSSALVGACRRAKADRLSALCAGLAGCGRSHGISVGRRMVRQALAVPGAPRCSRVTITSDAEVALRGAFLGLPGVVLIAGTGSVAIGCDANGRCERAGGWGKILDDEGSCQDVGRKALLEAMKSWDGRRCPWPLQDKVAAFFGVSGPDEMVVASSDEGFLQKIPGLAGLVLDAAREGDERAVGIVRQASKHLAEMVSAVATKLGFQKFELACVGGMFRDGELMLSALDEELKMLGLRCSLVRPELPPVGGALLIASSMLKKPRPRGFVARLKEGLTASWAA